MDEQEREDRARLMCDRITGERRSDDEIERAIAAGKDMAKFADDLDHGRARGPWQLPPGFVQQNAARLMESEKGAGPVRGHGNGKGGKRLLPMSRITEIARDLPVGGELDVRIGILYSRCSPMHAWQRHGYVDARATRDALPELARLIGSASAPHA